MLFRFSEKSGVVDNTNMEGSPVFIDVRSFNSTNQINQFAGNQHVMYRVKKLSKGYKGIAYRVCSNSDVSIIYNDKTIFKKALLIAQFGEIMHLPSEMFLQHNYAIEFYPEYGSIKSISPKVVIVKDK